MAVIIEKVSESIIPPHLYAKADAVWNQYRKSRKTKKSKIRSSDDIFLRWCDLTDSETACFLSISSENTKDLLSKHYFSDAAIKEAIVLVESKMLIESVKRNWSDLTDMGSTARALRDHLADRLEARVKTAKKPVSFWKRIFA